MVLKLRYLQEHELNTDKIRIYGRENACVLWALYVGKVCSGLCVNGFENELC